MKLRKYNMHKIINWIVIKWKQLWRTVWYNTANISYINNDIADWVYKINIVIDNKLYKWAWSFRSNLNIFESHIFDFNNDIYWKEIEIILLEKIRDNKKINSLDELKKLIENDIKIIKNNIKVALTFWTFDIVHEWHRNYLFQAKKYCDKLITIVATDNNIEKFKWKKPLNNIEKRINDVIELNITDEVISWDESNPMKWLDIYNPNYICLWYDQLWFSELLDKYIYDKNLKIYIIRLNPYKEDIYKSSLLKK